MSGQSKWDRSQVLVVISSSRFPWYSPYPRAESNPFGSGGQGAYFSEGSGYAD